MSLNRPPPPSCTVITTVMPWASWPRSDRMLLAEEDRRLADPDRPAGSWRLARLPDVRDIALRQVSTLVNNAQQRPELLSRARPQPEQIQLL